MEIEGKTIEEVKEIESLLEVEEEKITNLNCQDIYQKIYGIDIDEIKELKFQSHKEVNLDIAKEKGFDVRLMDRENTIKESKYKIINNLSNI